MAKHPYDPADFVAHADDAFASETELLRGANVLPKLSSQLRDRVLNAASAGYRQARRWAQARQAASFLCVCLITSVVLSPLAKMEWPHPAELASNFRQWRSSASFAQTDSSPKAELHSKPTMSSSIFPRSPQRSRELDSSPRLPALNRKSLTTSSSPPSNRATAGPPSKPSKPSAPVAATQFNARLPRTDHSRFVDAAKRYSTYLLESCRVGQARFERRPTNTRRSL